MQPQSIASDFQSRWRVGGTRTFLAICAHPWCCGYMFKVANCNMILMLLVSHMPRGHAVHVTMFVPYKNFSLDATLKISLIFQLKVFGICRAFFRRRNSCWSNLFSQDWQCGITLISITRYYPHRPQKTKSIRRQHSKMAPCSGTKTSQASLAMLEIKIRITLLSGEKKAVWSWEIRLYLLFWCDRNGHWHINLDAPLPAHHNGCTGASRKTRVYLRGYNVVSKCGPNYLCDFC